MKKILLAASLIGFGFSSGAAASIDARLIGQINSSPLGLIPVVITYDHKPAGSDISFLKSIGVAGGIVLRELPMILTAISKAQLEALRARPEIVSLYANRTFKPLTNVSRAFIGARDLMSDREVMLRNGGAPVSGRGIGIAYVDTGIDATHPDLQFGANVVQNVLFPLAELPLEFLSDFVWSP